MLRLTPPREVRESVQKQLSRETWAATKIQSFVRGRIMRRRFRNIVATVASSGRSAKRAGGGPSLHFQNEPVVRRG